MDVFIAGATGVLGWRLVERFSDRDHQVYGLVRDEEGATLVEAGGGIPRQGDVLDRKSLRSAVPDVDIVIHAATSIPTATRPSREDWAHNDRIRVTGAQNLVAVAGDTIDQFLFPSVVWVARQPDGSQFDETSDRHPDRGTRGVATTEDYLLEVASAQGFDVTILRCGLFYAHDAASTRQFAQNLLAGRMPIIGGGVFGRRDGVLSRVHADDAAEAFVAAAETHVNGIYHVVDDEPVSTGAYLAELADQLDASPPGPRVPRWLARLLLGKVPADLLAKPMPTSSDRFAEAVGWEPTVPTYREGLTQVVETWLDDGTIRPREQGYEWADR